MDKIQIKNNQKNDKNKKQNFFELYFTTILQIIEDKPNFQIPLPIYYLLIAVYYFQLAGYIFSHYEKKTLNDEKFGYIAYLNEVSPVTFLLYMKAHDTLTIICYLLMQLTMYFYFIYVGVFGYIKNYKKKIAENYKRQFQMINQFLNIFFTFYWWVFFTPYVEINSGMIVCGGNSFLTEYRDKTDYASCGKPIYFYILGVIGLILSNLTGLIIIFFFRSYEFDEGNYLKRRYKFLLALQLLTRFLTTFFFYLNINIVLVFKHVAAQFVGLSLLYDIYINWPFKNMKVTKFYTIATIAYWWAMTVVAIWIFTDEFPDSQLFYPYVILTIVFSGGMIVLINNKYTRIMGINVDNFERYYVYMDFYLEELQRLLTIQLKDEQAKFQLFYYLKYHQNTCRIQDCACQNQELWDYQNEINVENLYKFIDSQFKWALNHPTLRKNNQEHEHLSLKYISYLGKYRNNPTKAYLELKLLLSNRSNVSFYFKTISKILSKNIEFMMEQVYVNNTQQNQYQSQELQVQTILQLQEFKYVCVPLAVQFLKLKLEYWDKLRLGFNNMNQCLNHCLNFTKQGVKIQKKIENQVNSFPQQNNILYLRLKSIFNTIILKNVNQAWKDEQQIAELYKRDSGKESTMITNLSISEGNLVSLVVSIAKQKGKIISQISPKVAQFFGYSLQEFQNIQNINVLMPEFLKNIHDDILENMINRGYSILIKSRMYNYFMNGKNFLTPMCIFVDNTFQYDDDFCLNTSILKTYTKNSILIFDQEGKIQGISEELYDRLFTKDLINNQEKGFQSFVESQASPKSKGFQSILKNQKIIDVKNLYQNCFVQFMVPQLLKVFQNIQFSEEDFTSRIYEKQLISYQSSRIKIPNNFEVIKQEYDNTQISQRDTSVSGNSKFQSFKKSFASGATSRRIREVKLDLLDKECNQKTLNYLYNNQNIYSPNNIICDFACKMDLFLYNIITGSQNENNTVYFLMEVKELIPYTVARQQNSNRISSQRTQELRGQSFLGTMYMESQGGRSQTINQQKNSSIFNNSETNININDLTASQMIAKNLVPIEPPIEYNNISNYNNEEKKQKNKKVNPTIKELSQEDNVASNENNANNGEKGQKYKQGEQIKVFVKETDEEKNNVQKQNQYNIPDITQNQNDISSNQDILGLNSVNESTSRNLLNQIEINVDQSNNFQSQYNKAKNEYKYQNYLEDYHQTQNQQQKFGETSFNQPQISDVDVTINDQSKMMDFTPRNKDTEDKNISLPGSNEQNEQNQQFHQNSNSDQQQEYIDVESHINQNRNDTILEEDNKNLLFNEFEERVEEKNNQNHDNYEDQLTNSGDEGNNNYDSKMSAELQSIEKYYKKENENEIYEEDTDEEKEIINPNYNSRQSKKSLKTVKDFLSKKKIPTANNDNNKKPGIYQGQHSISSSNSLRGQFNINILSDLFGKEKRPQSLKQFENLLYFYIVAFVILVVVFYLFYLDKFDDQIQSLNYQNMPNKLNFYYQQAIMAGYCIIEQNLSLLNSDQVNYLGTYCEDSLVDAAKNYQNLLEEFSDEIINNSQLKEENLTIKILEAGEYQQQQMRVHQFVSLTSQELNEQYYSYQNGGTIQNESFQTIFQNQIIHQNLQFLIEKIYTSKLEDVNQNTIDSFIYFTIIVFGIFIFAIILMVPILMKIIQYQEKILLLITRIYEFETLIEVKQIQSSIHILNSQNEEWINTSFLEQEANKPAIDPSITQGKQQVLSNKIFQQSLHIYLWYILVGVKSILLTSFFGIIIILVAVYDQQLQPSLDLNTKVYLYDMYISQFTSTFELFIVTDIFENQYENFQPLDYDTLNNDLNKIYDNLTDFTTQFENYLNQEQSLINNNKINQMQSLLKNDLCTLLECTDLTDSQKSDYSNGVVGIVSSYLSMKNSQNHLLLESPSDENTSDHEEEVINYLNSQQNLTLLLKAYQIPITALQHISDTLLEANILLIKEIKDICQYYYMIIGILFILFILIWSHILKKNLRSRFSQLHLLLHTIPLEKLTEESTIYLLKNISKI